jgi:hypothetical protein
MVKETYPEVATHRGPLVFARWARLFDVYKVQTAMERTCQWPTIETIQAQSISHQKPLPCHHGLVPIEVGF